MNVCVDENEALVDALADAIRSDILLGELEIGSRLRQERLAQAFGVSRTPVREALRKLQAGGMVEVVPRRGAVVRGPRGADLREPYLIRAALEGLAADLAAARITNAQLSQLSQVEELFKRAAAEFVAQAGEGSQGAGALTVGAWETANNRFHDAVLEAADVARLKLMIADLHRSIPRHLTRAPLAEDPTLLNVNIREHARIREALARRDSAAARRCMTAHVLRSGDLVVAWFERQTRNVLSPCAH